MYRIDNATAISPIPTPAAVGPNPNYFFTNGNPGSGIPATIVDADWANSIQEEICYVIEQSGATLSKTDRTQLLTAIKYFLQSSTSNYAASTTAANTYTATLTPAPAAYVTGEVYIIKFTNHNTGAATLNLNSLGAKTIKRLNGTDLSAFDIVDGMIALLSYDGTNLQLLNRSHIADIQNSSLVYATSTTAANTYTASLSPAPSAYVAGLHALIQFTNANTGSATINLNSLGAKTIKRTDGGNLNAGDIAAGAITALYYDGTNFQLIGTSYASEILNSSFNYIADSGTANTYAATLSPAAAAYTAGMLVSVKIANTNTGASTLNVNSLGAQSIKTMTGLALQGGELVAGTVVDFIYDGTNFKLAYAVRRTNIQTFTSSGTYTPTANMYECISECVGGGGGGGGSANSSGSGCGAGGGAGAYSRKLSTAAIIGTSQTVTVGAGGNGGAAGNNTGTGGGDTSLGSICIAKGGNGGTGNAGNAQAAGVLGGAAASGTGDVKISGGEGNAGGGGSSTAVTIASGAGGSSCYGGTQSTQATLAGANASVIGAGGSGGHSYSSGGAKAGGNGNSGIVIVTEYLLV